MRLVMSANRRGLLVIEPVPSVVVPERVGGSSDGVKETRSQRISFNYNVHTSIRITYVRMIAKRNMSHGRLCGDLPL